MDRKFAETTGLVGFLSLKFDTIRSHSHPPLSWCSNCQWWDSGQMQWWSRETGERVATQRGSGGDMLQREVGCHLWGPVGHTGCHCRLSPDGISWGQWVNICPNLSFSSPLLHPISVSNLLCFISSPLAFFFSIFPFFHSLERFFKRKSLSFLFSIILGRWPYSSMAATWVLLFLFNSFLVAVLSPYLHPLPFSTSLFFSFSFRFHSLS